MIKNILTAGLIALLLSFQVNAQELDEDFAWCDTLARLSAIVQKDRITTKLPLPEYLKVLNEEIPNSDVNKALIIQIAVETYSMYKPWIPPQQVYGLRLKDCMGKRKHDVEDLQS